MSDISNGETGLAIEPGAVLHDALSVIFKNLNIRDLCQTAAVSKWL